MPAATTTIRVTGLGSRTSSSCFHMFRIIARYGRHFPPALLASQRTWKHATAKGSESFEECRYECRHGSLEGRSTKHRPASALPCDPSPGGSPRLRKGCSTAAAPMTGNTADGLFSPSQNRSPHHGGGGGGGWG